MSGEEKTVADEATDDALSQAWDSKEGAKESAKIEDDIETDSNKETPPVEKPASAETKEPEDDENLDHKESSKLGRKFKGLENKVEQILARLEQPKKPEEAPIEVPEVIATPQDVDKYLEAKEQRKLQEQSKYEQSYVQQVQKLATANEDLHDEIFAEMLQNFNVKHSSDAAVDAKINYAEAKAAVLMKKISKPSVPQRERSERTPVQPAASATRTAAKAFVLPKLDAEAQAYVNYLRSRGESDEEIAKQLV